MLNLKYKNHHMRRSHNLTQNGGAGDSDVVEEEFRGVLSFEAEFLQLCNKSI